MFPQHVVSHDLTINRLMWSMHGMLVEKKEFCFSDEYLHM